MHFARLQHVALQRFHQRAHQRAASTDPPGHRRAVQFDAIPGVDCRLPVQRLMIGEFRHQDLGQQARAGDAALDRAARGRRLHDTIATGACLLAAHGPDYLEGRVDDFQLFGDIFPEQLELAAASGASWFLRIEDAHLAHQVLRQRLAYRLGPDWRGRRFDLFGGTIFGDQVFQTGFELLDLAVDLLGFAAELHALELGDLELELLDFERAHVERLLQYRDRVAQLAHFAIACQQQRFQGSDIVGKVGVQNHAPSLPACFPVYNTDNGVQVRSGCFQLIPSSSIDNWACVKCTLPLLACGQMK